jgi:hypothetical protein
MEGDTLCLHFPVLDVAFVATHDDGNVLTNTNKISMPVGYIFICHPRRNIKQDNSTIRVYVITISQSSKFLLSSGVPNIKLNQSSISVELQRMNFNTQCG